MEPHLQGVGCGAGDKAPHEGSSLASGGTGWVGPEWGTGAHLCQVEAKNGWGWGGAPTSGRASSASLGKKFCGSGARGEMARAAGDS